MITSPLTKDDKISLIKEFDSQLIVSLYKNQLGVDVSSYFKDIPAIRLYECQASGYRFYFPFSIEGDSKFYEMLSTSPIQYYPGWKWENEVASKHIPANSRIMDVGCGDGTFLEKIKRDKNADCSGIEFNPDAIKKAESKGVKVFNATPENVAAASIEAFDVVTSFQVLEHISQIKEFLQSKVTMTRRGGLIVIGVPHNNPYLYKKDKYHVLNLPPHHMGLWNEKALKNLQNYFPIEFEAVYIEPLDDLAYYSFVQLGMTRFYKLLYKGKIFRAGFRVFNKILKPVQQKIKGRNIVIIFKKS